MPLRVDILGFPDVQLLDIAGPFQVLASANELAAHRGLPRPYDIHLVAAEPGPMTATSGLTMTAEALPQGDMALDTLIVAGGPGVDQVHRSPPLIRWVQQRSTVARRTTSVCSGAFVLAAAGLLDGRRCTTHWSRCAQLAAAFPALHVEEDPIYVTDGPIWTSAGVTAGIDMTLAMVEADLGRTVATTIARHLVVFAKRPGGQSQFSTGLALSGSEDTFDALHGWIGQNLGRELPVSALAEQAGMTERSFVRHYRRVTGTTPARAVERIRVEAARQALSSTKLSMKRIARDCGFGSEETMRRGFMRALSVSPHAYRDHWSAS